MKRFQYCLLKIKNPQGLKRPLRIAPWFASSSPSSAGRNLRSTFSVPSSMLLLQHRTLNIELSFTGRYSGSPDLSLPSHSNERTVACCRQRRLLCLHRVRITAAGPLPVFTEFPIKHSAPVLTFSAKWLEKTTEFMPGRFFFCSDRGA